MNSDTRLEIKEGLEEKVIHDYAEDNTPAFKSLSEKCDVFSDETDISKALAKCNGRPCLHVGDKSQNWSNDTTTQVISHSGINKRSCSPNGATGISVISDYSGSSHCKGAINHKLQNEIVEDVKSTTKKKCNVAGGKKMRKCNFCLKAFKDLVQLNRHVKIHSNEKHFPFYISDKSECHNSYRLDCNQKGEKQLSCSVCEKSFTQLASLKIHERLHIEEKPFVCDVCGKSFTVISYLKRHKRVHTGERPFICDVCGKSFPESSNLKKHERTHTGEKPYVCDVCKKSFSMSCDLKKHKYSHTGERPFVCDICESSFAYLNSLKAHKRIHSGEKPYSCCVCGKLFADSSNLKKHTRTHTGEVKNHFLYLEV